MASKIAPHSRLLVAQAAQEIRNRNLNKAKSLLEYVLKVEPDNLDALYEAALVAGLENNYKKALDFLDLFLQLDPSQAEVWSNRGNALSKLQNLEQALASFEKALSLNASLSVAWSNRGNVLYELKKFDQALVSYDTALSLRPKYAEAWSNRGNTLSELRKYEEALASYDNAIQLSPQHAIAWANRGNALKELKQFNQALAAYDNAIKLMPDYAEAWSGRGVALKEMKQFESALTSFSKAISLNPAHAQAHNNLGNLLKDLGRIAEACDCYRESMRLAPDYVHAHSNLLFSLNYLELLGPEEALAEARRYGAAVSAKALPKFSTWLVDPHAPRLRVGFVSGDFNNHPVGYFVEGLIEQLSRDAFEIFAFPTSALEDELTHRIRPYFQEWSPIFGKSDLDAAAAIREKGIHVLVDLSGHTAHNRLPVFSYKPAPVQVSWLGYFASTGLPEMDYFLGDPHMSPAGEQHHFTERVCKLAQTWFCMKPPAERTEVSQLPALASGQITFACFGNLSKMNDQVVRVWSAVLQKVSKSRLLLKSKQLADPKVMEEVRQRFVAQGVEADRLLLEGPDSRLDYFKAYNRVDLVLDTFPYPGGTTSVDALWMGVPVLTLKGDRFLSHLGESIAINSGHPEWVAQDHEDYVLKASQLAADTQKLAQLRQILRDQVLNSPLYNPTQFTKNFSDTLWDMCENKPI